MKTETIKLRVSTSQKKAIKESSKNSKSMSAWILEKLSPETVCAIKEDKVLGDVIKSCQVVDVILNKRCMAPYCKSLETTSKAVHGATVWLCSTHYDKG